MKPHCLILLFLMVNKSHSFKPNHQIERQTKSIFSNKPCKELFTPARYIGMKNLNYEQPVGNNNMGPYFPDVEYPTNILESSKPYFYNMGESMIGPFPDDVKSSYRALVEKNIKEFEGMKTKIDFTFNALNCLQDIKPVQEEEALGKELEVVSKEDDNAGFVEDIGEEISGETQNNMIQDEENTVDETESNETSSESDETDEDFMQNTEIITSENEEETLIDNCFQSCESLQYYSNEIKEQLAEAKPKEQMTDDALEIGDGNVTLVEALELETKNNETDYVEEGLCSVPESDENIIAFDKFRMLDIIKKPNIINVNKKPFGFRRKPCKKL